MRLVLHIGATKTGSSALQAVLHERREDLLAAGALYSSVGVRSSAHHVIAAALHPGAWRMHRDELSETPAERHARFDAMAADIRDEFARSGAATLVLSSEYWWSSFDPDVYRAVAAAFPGAAVEVVAFVRRPDEWAVSSYLQAVKSGETREFPLWVEQALLRHTSGLYAFRVVNRWAYYLAARAVRVVRYEAARANVYGAFCEAVGLDVDTRVPIPQVNPSPTREGLELLLAINRSDASPDEKAARRRAVMRAHQAQEGTGADLVDPAHFERLLRVSAASEALLRTTFAPPARPAPPEPAPAAPAAS